MCEIKKILQSSEMGILASTIDNKDLKKPLENVSLIKGIDKTEIKKLYMPIEKTPIKTFEQRQNDINSKKSAFLEWVNERHLSMNWSFITSQQPPNIYKLSRMPENTQRDFAYLVDPNKMLDLILDVSKQDKSSNSNLTENQIMKWAKDETNIEKMKSVYDTVNGASNNQNSEIKSLGFKEDAFLGILCQIDCVKNLANWGEYEKVLNEMRTLIGKPIMIYHFINPKVSGKLELIHTIN